MSDDSGTTRPPGLLRADDIVAGYGDAPIIHGVSLRVGSGEIAVIIGPNGSGKSTFLKALVGIADLHSGCVMLDDVNLTGKAAEQVARSGVGYVPQVNDVFETLTVKENLEIGGYLLMPRLLRDRMAEVLEIFPSLVRMMDRRAGKLSGGERKMLAMGRVLMTKPRLFLLDEPSANLAPAIAAELLQEHVPRLAASGAAVLLVEQRVRSALSIADWAYVFGGGFCRMEGPPEVLAALPEFVDSFLGGQPEPGSSEIDEAKEGRR